MVPIHVQVQMGRGNPNPYPSSAPSFFNQPPPSQPAYPSMDPQQQGTRCPPPHARLEQKSGEDLNICWRGCRASGAILALGFDNTAQCAAVHFIHRCTSQRNPAQRDSSPSTRLLLFRQALQKFWLDVASPS